MFQYIYKYLVLKHEISLPGIGVFVLEKEPAQLDAATKVIHAPLQTIRFRSNANLIDKELYQFLAVEMNLDVFQAIKKFQDFCYHLKHEVQLNKWVELPGMGILTQGVRDEIKFKSTPVLKDYYPALPVEKVSITDDREPVVATAFETAAIQEEQVYVENKKRRDYWWIYAIIIALISAAAIFYYYYYIQPSVLSN